MTFPAPLTDREADLTGFEDMPFEFRRFARSDLVAMSSPEGIVAALFLWGSSWFELPAGSLTDDDRALAQAAGYGRAVAAWVAVKDEALRGWVKCSDGRLYHPVVAEKVNESWRKRLDYWHRKYKDAIRAHNRRNPNDERTPLEYDPWLAAGRPEGIKDEARTVRDGELPLEPEQKSAGLMSDVHRTNGESPPEKGQSPTHEGNGVEGNGSEGSLIPVAAYARSPSDERKAAIDPFDVIAEADRLARRAGVPHSQPTHVGWNIDMVRQWHGDGIDVATIEAEIDKFRLDQPDRRVTTLSFFDTGVRAVIAAREAKARKGKPHRPGITAPPVAPLAAQDADDDRVRRIRAGLNGRTEHAADRIALAIQGDTLIVTARSAYAAAQVDRGVFAKLFGSNEIEVRVQ